MAEGPWTEYQRPGRRQSQQQPAPQRPQAASVKAPASQSDVDKEAGTFLSRSAGIAQGGLGLAEELGRFVEHATGTKLAPDFIRDKLKSFRDYGRSSRAGRIGEVVGATGATMLMPEARLGSALTGAISGAMQPVENSGDYWFDKAMQTGTGAASGLAVGNPLARWIMSRGALHSLFPFHTYGLHYPLHHLAHQASRTPPLGGPAMQKAAGAIAGRGEGTGIDEPKNNAPPPSEPSEDEEQPPLAPAPTPKPTPPPPPAVAMPPGPNFSQRFQGGQ